jgi:hypothetical protein
MEIEKTEFEVVENGTSYNLPTYSVGEEGVEISGEPQNIKLLRKNNSGILHETLLSMMIHDLMYKSTFVPSEETDYTIKCLEEALVTLQKRHADRQKRGVLNTDSK